MTVIGGLHKVVVVGTGPSACAVVSSLLDRGVRPLVLDSAEPAFPTAGPSGSLDMGTVFKTWNGSDAMYRSHPYSSVAYESGLSARAGNYFGGLSRVWGATFGKYLEYQKWPHDCIPTQGDWEAVGQLVPHAVVGEALPSTQSTLGHLPMEPRLQSLIRCSASKSTGIAVPACLAIDTEAASRNACNLEGTCLQGCPRDSIWWSGLQFTEWEAQGAIDIRRGLFVESLNESAQHVDLNVVTIKGSLERVRAQHAFLGSGVLSTSAMLVSSGLVAEITVRDSQTAFGGMVSLRGRWSPPYSGPSLSQVWFRTGPSASFMAQMYPPDASHVLRLRRKLPRMPQLALRRLNDHFFPFIAYLDSQQSGTVSVKRSGDGVLISIGSLGDRRAMYRNVAKVSRRVLRSGFALPPFVLEMAPPGGGFHMGGSMPHGPATDVWGRPQGSRRIHLVDSSVIPHIEAGSLTPTMMANAYRIARTTPLVESP